MSNYLEQMSSGFVYVLLADGGDQDSELAHIADSRFVDGKTGQVSFTFYLFEGEWGEVDASAQRRLLNLIHGAKMNGGVETVDIDVSVCLGPLAGVTVPVEQLSKDGVIDEIWIEAFRPGPDTPEPAHGLDGLKIHEMADDGSLITHAEYHGRHSLARQNFFDGELRETVSRVAPGSRLVVEFHPEWHRVGVTLFADLMQKIADSGITLVLRLATPSDSVPRDGCAPLCP